MHQLIITRILKRGVVTLSELEDRAKERGVSLSELYESLEKVHQDKRIEVVNLASGVTYRPAKVKPAPKPTHNPWTPELRAEADELTRAGTAIPFYNPEFDGTSPVYGVEYKRFIKQKNADLKRQAEGMMYTRKNANARGKNPTSYTKTPA